MRMRLISVRLGDRELDEKERKERKHGTLHDADKHLKSHNWDGQKDRHEESDYSYQYLTSKDVAEESEGERDESRHFRDKLDDAYNEIDRRGEIEELTSVPPETEREDPRDLDKKDNNDRKRERYIKIRIDASQERNRLPHLIGELDRSDTGRELCGVCKRYEQEEGQQNRKQPTRPGRVLKRRGYKVARSDKEELKCGLKPSGEHLEARPE